MEESTSFVSLLLVIFLAFLVPIILSRFKSLRLPVVVGEIIAGIIIGQSGFQLVSNHDHVLDLLAELGFVFLMFLSGMEIDFSGLGFFGAQKPKKNGPRTWGPLSLGGMSFFLTILLSSVLGLLFFRLGLVKNPWMLALILSTTSLGVVMPILKENGMLSGPFGQTILIAAMIADFATMLLITVLVAVISSGLTLDILLIGILFVAFFLIYNLGTRFFNQIPGVRRVFDELSQASSQIKVRAAFTMMLVFIALSEMLGTEVILGAFLAGAVVALLRTSDDAQLGHKLEAIGFGFFIPIFFIMVGVNFNFSALLNSPQAILLVPLLLGAAILVKLVPALVFRLRFSWRESLSAGALLSARLSLIIAASAIGLRLGIIGESVNAAIILVALITVTLAPLIFNRFVPRPVRVAPPIIVASANDLGLRVARQLNAHGEPVIVIDSNEKNINRARQRGLDVVRAELDKVDSSAAPYLETARAVICTSSDQEFNYRICELARKRYGIEHVVVQTGDSDEQKRFGVLGVQTLDPMLDQATMLALVGRNPSMYQLLTRTDDDKEIAMVLCNKLNAGKHLRDLQLPGDLLVLAIHREGDLQVPHGNTKLEHGDQLTLVGSMEAVALARQMFSQTSL